VARAEDGCVTILDAGDVDAGTPVVITLGKDYGCQDAPKPVQLDADAGWLYTTARVDRVDCMLTRCQVERDFLRNVVDAGTPGDAKSNAWIVTTAICAISAVFSAYAANRTARKLPLWP